MNMRYRFLKTKNQPEICFFELGNAYSKRRPGKGDEALLIRLHNLSLIIPEAYQRLSEVSMQIEVPEDGIKESTS